MRHRKAQVLTKLNTLGLIDDTQELAIKGGNIGMVVIASLSNPNEASDNNYSISLLACEQLEVLAKLASNTGTSAATDVSIRMLQQRISPSRFQTAGRSMSSGQHF